MHDYSLMVLYVFSGLIGVWVVVRVAGSAWYNAKKTYTAAMMRLLDKEERKRDGGKKQERTD